MGNAFAAFFENLPIRRDAAAARRIYRRALWGGTAEFFVLDCRSERRPSTRNRPNAQYISPEQLEWLKAGLLESRAVFKAILNSVPITNFPGLFDVISSDRWEGYPAQRSELLGFIEDEGIQGVLWVAGDFHLASAGRVARSGIGSRAIEVLAGPGAQSPNPIAGVLRNDRQFDFSTATNNYTTFSLDPSSRSVTVSFHDANDSVLGERVYRL